MLLQAALAALAAVPFLPSGRGALILIFGGLAMLPLSLMLSRVASWAPWAGRVAKDAARLGLGPCRVLSRDSSRCIVALGSCRTCTEDGGGPCDRERRALQLAIHARAPQASVVELSCNGARHGACTFEIRRGRAA